MKHKQLFFFFYILSFLSCKKEEAPHRDPCGGVGPADIQIAQELENFKFKSGTYWVFLDTISGITDSIHVNSYSEEVTQSPCQITFHIYSFNATSFPSMQSIDYELKGSELNKNSTTIYGTNPPAHLDSLFIYDQYYYNIIVSTVPHDYSEGNNISRYYLNSDFGFLRLDVDSNNISISRRFLIRKNIIR
jgi:hypothetical protein